jgi:hypothetical protein
MSCERFSEAIAGHAAGADLEPAAAAHLGTCEACTARLETQRRLLADVDAELAGALSLSASPEFVARVTSSVSATQSRSIAWRPAAAWVGLAAAAAIVAVSFLRGPDVTVSPVPRESAVAPAPATPPAVVAETGAPPQTDRPPAVRRSRPRPSRLLAAARPLEEPAVIVSADQARAIARLRELMNAGRLTDRMLPPEQPHEASELTVAPLEIPEIKVPDVESIGRTPGSAVDQEPKEH